MRRNEIKLRIDELEALMVNVEESYFDGRDRGDQPMAMSALDQLDKMLIELNELREELEQSGLE